MNLTESGHLCRWISEKSRGDYFKHTEEQSSPSNWLCSRYHMLHSWVAQFVGMVWRFVNIHRHAKCEIAFWAESERDQVNWWKTIYQNQLVCCSADVGRSISICQFLQQRIAWIPFGTMPSKQQVVRCISCTVLLYSCITSCRWSCQCRLQGSTPFRILPQQIHRWRNHYCTPHCPLAPVQEEHLRENADS